MMAQRNQLREALSDSQLKQMLEQISDSVRRLPVHLLHPRCERLTDAAPRSTQRTARARTPCGRAVRGRVRVEPNPKPKPKPNPNSNPNPLRQGAGGETRSTVVIDRRRMANDDSDSDVSLDGL